jgi:beta-1,4-N-acetylglucosaminyltransferase
LRNGGLKGTGSLLDGLHFRIPVVLVPNTDLADNHQEELADKFEKNGLCIRGHLEYVSSVPEPAETRGI